MSLLLPFHPSRLAPPTPSRALYLPLPEDTLIDDVLTPMNIATQGYRIIHDPQARGWDPQQLDPSKETIRKARTLAGNFQLIFRYPHWLLPWKQRLAWQLISHKYMRVLAPSLMVTQFIANALLAPVHPAYMLLFIAQVAFYIVGFAGILCNSVICSWRCVTAMVARFTF